MYAFVKLIELHKPKRLILLHVNCISAFKSFILSVKRKEAKEEKYKDEEENNHHHLPWRLEWKTIKYRDFRKIKGIEWGRVNH